ncbi:MAG TPA: M28 family peptidase [Bacteroidota bacterium]|nr:M28 family peptidase [Bacteroidota bacterium]
MKHTMTRIIVLLSIASCPAWAQMMPAEKIDTVALARIKDEGLNHSHVMDILSTLADVYGPRLGWSPEFRKAAEWASGELKGWGVQNVHFQHWAPLGRGWSLRNFSAMVESPVPFPVIAYPAAWSPGIDDREAEAVYFNAKSIEQFDAFKGKLKGKFVLISAPEELKAHFEPAGERLADSALLRMANADMVQGARGGRRGAFGRYPTIDSMFAAMRRFSPEVDSQRVIQLWEAFQVNPRKLEFAEKEGAAAVITEGRGDDGTVLVQSATVPQSPDVPYNQRMQPYDPKSPEIVPQVVFASEHYNRIVRMIEKGEHVRLAINLEVATTKADSGFDIIGEIPGSDLKDEIVMIGGHFDSWHSGTGATDNGTGTAACMEAMRILETLAQKDGLRPRRTIRIGLWGSEEEGLIGSREYVSAVLGRREGGTPGAFGGPAMGGELRTTPEYDRFSVYMNHDNGSGRIRGIYLQGNEAARGIFRKWFTAYGDPTAQTITIENTGGTDHQSFDAIGLPGFQFIQDPLEYDSRTHHYNMDVFDRVQGPDMKQAATIIAFFAYTAANRDAKFPRKPMPGSGPRASSN